MTDDEDIDINFDEIKRRARMTFLCMDKKDKTILMLCVAAIICLITAIIIINKNTADCNAYYQTYIKDNCLTTFINDNLSAYFN